MQSTTSLLLLCAAALAVVSRCDRIAQGANTEWSSATESREHCYENGTCVEPGSGHQKPPASDLVKDRPLYTRDEWKFANIKVSEEYLVVKGQVVMDRSEAPYMEKLAKIVAEQGGRIMETGYGMGISAKLIHKYNASGITEHVIIEGNADVFNKNVLPFAANYSTARPMFGFYEEVTPLLRSNSFDAVLYDTFPMDTEDLSTPLCLHQRKIMKEVHRILKPGGIFTYFANTNTVKGDRKALIKAGFKNEDISIGVYKMSSILGDCPTYPNCKEVPALFQVPRVRKAAAEPEPASDGSWFGAFRL